MTTVKIPIKTVAGSQGYDAAYIASGAYRQVPYQVWLQEQGENAGLAGRTFRAPERKPDGSLDGGGSHVMDRDEIIARFADLLKPGTSEGDAAKVQAAVALRELGDLGKRAAAGDGEALHEAVRRSMLQLRATDPVLAGTPATPGDFLAQFAVPLDTTELLTLCDETSLWRALPEVTKDTQTELWREMDQLEFASGCADIAFPAGDCPEDFVHHGANLNVDLKHIGARKSLTESDILHSRGSIAAGYGITALNGPFKGDGLPGEQDVASLVRANISDLKAKEMQLATILVLNGWDQLLVDGDATGNPDEFDGIVNYITALNGARCNDALTSGTLNVNTFDQFMVAGCARPQAIIGHPSALAAIALAYFDIGNGSIFYNSNNGIVPGLHFASEIMTGFGPISLIADARFPRTDNANGSFNSTVYPVRLRHNGEQLIYKRTQIPLSARDLTPGCTAITFEIFAVTALIVKAMCAQACYNADFAGLVDDACNFVHPCLT